MAHKLWTLINALFESLTLSYEISKNGIGRKKKELLITWSYYFNQRHFYDNTCETVIKMFFLSGNKGDIMQKLGSSIFIYIFLSMQIDDIEVNLTENNISTSMSYSNIKLPSFFLLF